MQMPMTPEQQTARTQRLVSAAKAMLSLQVGLYVGARRIENALVWLGPEFKGKHSVFADFTRAVPLDIPVGTARLLWGPEVVLETDERLASVESKYRTELLMECIEIMRRYG